MIEIGGAPSSSGVARGALRKGERRAGGGVGGIVGLLPSDEVAAGSAASRGSNLQIVVIGNVAVGAGVDFAGGGVLVQILKRESRGIVVPGRNPIGGGVAGGALGGGEPSGNVIGDSAAHGGGGVVLVLVANDAIGVCRGEIVIVVQMTIGARCGNVRAGESPAGGAVIEHCGGPGNRVVTRGAVGGGKRRARGRVRRIIGLLPGGEVTTGIAAIVGLRSEIVVAANVAIGTGRDFAGGRELM